MQLRPIPYMKTLLTLNFLKEVVRDGVVEGLSRASILAYARYLEGYEIVARAFPAPTLMSRVRG